MSAVLEFRPYGASEPAPLPTPSAAPRAAPTPDSALAAPCREGGDGPDLPPLDPYLRNTPIERIRAMFAQCLAQGLIEKDTRWVKSDAFLTVCEYAGLEGSTPERIRELYLSGQLNLAALSYWNTGPKMRGGTS